MSEDIAGRLAMALTALAGEPSFTEPTPEQTGQLLHDAAVLYDCLRWGEGENLGRRRTRWKVLLRRALFAAASACRRRQARLPEATSELVEQLRSEGLEKLCGSETALDLESSVSIAREIHSTDAPGLRSTLILGDAIGVAVALGHLSEARIFLATWDRAGTLASESAGQRLGIQIHQAGAFDPTQDLPMSLRGRFDTVLVTVPIGGFDAHKALLSGLRALGPSPGSRLFWTGHPGRQLDYFGLYSSLARHGYMLDTLRRETATFPLDAEFAHQLLCDLLATPEAEPMLDPEPLQALLAERKEHEHLHLFRPADEIVLRGRNLDLVPLQAADIGLYERWLTPEFGWSMGFDEDRPRPSPEELQLENWYPSDEWWLARDKDRVGVGVVHLLLGEFWTRGTMPFDIGIAEPANRGRGWMKDLLELSYARVFNRLEADALWANVNVENVPVCRGYRSGFFQTVRQFVEPRTGEVLEHIRITAGEYRARVASGDLFEPAS